jgi:transposase
MDKASMNYDVYVGIDVGKTKHHVVALGKTEEMRYVSQPIAQDEKEIAKVLKKVSDIGSVLVIVDQYGNIGRLVVAVCRAMAIDVAHIAPRTFKKIADTYSEAKTDALDAYIIADTARTAPRHIDLVVDRNETIEELKVLISARDDIVRERTAHYNRLHDLLMQVCPPLETLFAKDRLHSDLVLRLLARYGGPVGFKAAGKAQVSVCASRLKYHKTRGPALVKEVFKALDTLVVRLPATAVIEERIKRIASRVVDLNAEVRELEEMIETRSVLISEIGIVQSIPGIGPIYGATIVCEIGDIKRFPSANHLASYGAVAPVKRQSGTSLNKTRKAKGGNRRLKNALIRSSFAACCRDASAKAYYEKKRGEGKTHKQILHCLARRRVDVIYALLRDGTQYLPLAKAA